MITTVIFDLDDTLYDEAEYCRSGFAAVAEARIKLVAPLSWDNLAGRWDERLEEIAVFDELGAGIGSRIAISEGREAAMPFHPEVKPIDAYNAAILDTLDYETPTLE